MNLKNTYIIGDVHGCYYTLLNLVKQLPKDANKLTSIQLETMILFEEKVDKRDIS